MISTYEQNFDYTLLVLKKQLDWWRHVAPAFEIDPLVCREEALNTEMAMIEVIDDSLACD